MTIKYIAGLLFLLGCATSLFSQPLREPTYEMKLIKAEELTAEGDYYNALDMYEECYKETRDAFLIRDIAHLNYKLRDFERAEKWYERMVERPERYYTQLIDTLYYARILKTNRNHALAFDMYQQYIALSENDSLTELAENELIGLDMSAKMKAPNDIFVEPLPKDVNSSLTEASPIDGTDGYLYYSTFKRKSKITITADEDDFHFKIYRTKKKDDDEWERPDKLSKKINREDYHTGNVAFSDDGGTMFFTRSRLSGDSMISSTIYYSTFDGEDWEGPRQLAGVNGDWIATHPAHGALFGDEVLYFVSDMPGGYGGFDIYYCTNRGGEYSTPVNLGDVINTKGDDVTPFYEDGKLYYSSDGKPGVGGLDVFSSTWDGTTWSDPKNMGLPHNSSYDDLYFKWDDEEKKGYLVSNRPYPKKRSSKSETCCDDIFLVAEQDIAINTVVTSFDKDGKPLTGSKVTIKEYKRGDPEISDSRRSEKGNTFDFPLKVDKQYRVVIDHPDYKSDSFEINTVGLLDPKTFEKQFFLTPKDKSDDDEVRVITINEPIRLHNIYYDFDDDQILPEAEEDLQRLKELMDDYPSMVIELSSHTDARGNDDYNENLSQRRAESARTWLIQQGISPQRIKAVGYGESQILNQCKNGVSCEESEHRFNRRTEFKIIEGPTSIELKKEVIDSGSDGSGSIWPSHDESPYKGMAGNASGISEFDLIQASEHSARKAILKIDKKFHDFGIVFPGEKRTYTIKIKNTGDAVLVLERVSAAKCLDITWPEYPILPGHDSELEVEYDSTDRKKGEDELTIDIIANTEQRVHSTRVRAFVQ